MVCKAVLMDDFETFAKIDQSTKPGKTKQLGRQVSPWDNQRWDENVIQIAIEVCYQKFSKVDGLKAELLATGNSLIAETTKGDKNWGNGIDLKDYEKSKSPWLWEGANILGWALMVARERIAK